MFVVLHGHGTMVTERVVGGEGLRNGARVGRLTGEFVSGRYLVATFSDGRRFRNIVGRIDSDTVLIRGGKAIRTVGLSFIVHVERCPGGGGNGGGSIILS